VIVHEARRYPDKETCVTDLDGLEGWDVPIPFVAVTETVYAVSTGNPVIVHEVDGAIAMQNNEPTEAVARYELIDDPPSLPGVSQFTMTTVSLGATCTPVGEPGA
jgi:hypothetical protein